MTRQNLSDPITLRLPTDVLEEIEAIAQTCDRSRSWVMVRALRQYLAGEGADITAIRTGRNDIASSGGHDLADVLAEIDAIIAAKVA